MLNTENEKIRPLIIFVGLFMASMLFQTGSSNLGTLVALVLILLCIFSYFYEYGLVLRIDGLGTALILFAVISTIITMFRSEFPSYYIKLIAQIILFVLLLGADKVNNKEENYLLNIFIVASLFYAIVGIVTSATSTRYYHGSIMLFGTGIDPNFYGIPIVASATLLLYKFLIKKNHNILNILGYVVLLIAIMYTASKGNFLALLVGNVFVLLDFIFNTKIKGSRKAIYSIILVIAAVILYQYIQDNFLEAWQRMTSITEEGSDNGRFELWEIAIEQWNKYPLFGGGMYSNYIIHGKATHNTYLQVLSEEGLCGIVVFITMLLSMLRKTFKYNRLYFYLLSGMVLQIAFLDALDNRCVWAILCWIALLPSANYEESLLDLEEEQSW